MEEYEKAFSGVDVEGKGVISKDWGVGRGGLAFGEKMPGLQPFTMLDVFSPQEVH